MKEFKINFGSFGTLLIFLFLVWITHNSAVFVIGWILQFVTCFLSFIITEIFCLALYGKSKTRPIMFNKYDCWIIGVFSVVLLILTYIPLVLYHIVGKILMVTEFLT